LTSGAARTTNEGVRGPVAVFNAKTALKPLTARSGKTTAFTGIKRPIVVQNHP
jgi:hypothetical protein